LIITIDGAAGTGKTSVGKLIAKKLNFQFLDTGKIYRAFTLKLIQNNIAIDNLEEILYYLGTTNIEYKYSLEKEEVFIDNSNVSDLLTDKEVEKRVSIFSKISEVRDKMTSLQRNIVSNKNFIVAGRDIGTVVLPKANIKIFLLASLKERARRRSLEKINENYENILKSMNDRDTIDTTRKIAPLKAAEDANIIHTDNLSLIEVSQKIISLIK
tara:strand:- start:1605 stop:2243 length:639 start_codon:yes stop_codon:yes gene_type:complete